MVYYFKSTAVEPAAFIYVGKDKVESASNMSSKCRAGNGIDYG